MSHHDSPSRQAGSGVDGNGGTKLNRKEAGESAYGAARSVLLSGRGDVAPTQRDLLTGVLPRRELDITSAPIGLPAGGCAGRSTTVVSHLAIEHLAPFVAALVRVNLPAAMGGGSRAGSVGADEPDLREGPDRIAR